MNSNFPAATRIASVVFVLYLTLFPRPVQAQAIMVMDSSSKDRQINNKKLRWLLTGQSFLFAGSTFGLSKAWYKDPLNNFTIRDDTHEWLQVDKVGHLYSAYQIARFSETLYLNTGISQKKATLYSALSGIIFLTPIEILDGFSDEYGFSPGDMTANILGSALCASQKLIWGELRIIPKFSFHYTDLAQLRPELLGSGYSDRWLKDYNGQTYWFSASPASFLSASKWPGWLCISFGYGIGNTIAANTKQSSAMGFTPHREYYLSLDIDFTKIRTRKKWIKTAAFLVNSIKIPAPTLSIHNNSVKAHALYF